MSEQRWAFNIAVLQCFLVAMIWIPFPLYEIIKYWPTWNSGFIFVAGGVFIGFMGFVAGYAN